MHARGLRVVLVAAALVALLHGLLLKALEPDLRTYRDRPGRAHDGRRHETLGQQFLRSREDDLREMFEFASQAARPPQAYAQDLPAQRSDCTAPLELDMDYSMEPAACVSGPEASGYAPTAIIQRYKNERVMNGGLGDGIAAYDDSIGFGGSVL